MSKREQYSHGDSSHVDSTRDMMLPGWYTFYDLQQQAVPLAAELLLGDEGAMEAIGHSGRQLDGGHGLHGDGVYDEQLRLSGDLVVDEYQKMAVILRQLLLLVSSRR